MKRIFLLYVLLMLSYFSFSQNKDKKIAELENQLQACRTDKQTAESTLILKSKNYIELEKQNDSLRQVILTLQNSQGGSYTSSNNNNSHGNCDKLNAKIAKLESDLTDQKARNKADNELLNDCLNGKTDNSQTPTGKIDYKTQLAKCAAKLEKATKDLKNCQNKTDVGTSTKPTTTTKPPSKTKDERYNEEVTALKEELKKKLKSKDGHFAFQVPRKNLYGAKYTAYVVNSKKAKDNLKIYWKDGNNVNYSNLGDLKKTLDKESESKLIFAMNGGMYHRDQTPVGLLIIDGKEQNSINLNKKAPGNFGLVPNGVFYIKEDGSTGVIESNNFMSKVKREDVKYATQSGPMLIIDGEYHPALNRWSSNKLRRNGVGILEDGRVVFVISKEATNFYDFATLFKAMGCKNALYLDGTVSRMYCPEAQSYDKDGRFGPIIGITEF